MHMATTYFASVNSMLSKRMHFYSADMISEYVKALGELSAKNRDFKQYSGNEQFWCKSGREGVF